MSSIRRGVDQATRDDQADTAAPSSSPGQANAGRSAPGAESASERDSHRSTHDNAPASVPGDPLSPQPGSSGESGGTRLETSQIEVADDGVRGADTPPSSSSGAESRSLVASARAKIVAARRSISERLPAGELPTQHLATDGDGPSAARRPTMKRTADDRTFGAPPTTPREPTPAGQPMPRDDSPAIAALRRFDDVTVQSSDEAAESWDAQWGKRRSTVTNAERHLIAPVQRAVGRRPRVRKVTRVVRHVDPWTVFKVAAVFSMVIYGVLLTAGVLLWNVAHTTGTIDNIEQFFETFGWTEFELRGGQIYHSAWIAGLFGALALTGLAVLAATLFNLITDLVGGVRFTVLEEEVVEKTVSPMRRFTVRRTERRELADQ